MDRKISKLLLAVLLGSGAGQVNAEAVTDGTAGEVQRLSGAMLIPESLGTRAGNNLFHSF